MIDDLNTVGVHPHNGKTKEKVVEEIKDPICTQTSPLGVNGNMSDDSVNCLGRSFLLFLPSFSMLRIPLN